MEKLRHWLGAAEFWAIPKAVCPSVYICPYKCSQGTSWSEIAICHVMWQGLVVDLSGHVAVAGLQWLSLRRQPFRGTPLCLGTHWMSSFPDFSRAWVPVHVIETWHRRVVGHGAGLSVTQLIWVHAVKGRQQCSIANIWNTCVAVRRCV